MLTVYRSVKFYKILFKWLFNTRKIQNARLIFIQKESQTIPIYQNRFLITNVCL